MRHEAIGTSTDAAGAFDPFTASLAQAQEQPNAYSLRGPVMQWGAAQEMLLRRAYFEANPLDGVARCLVADLVAPDWLVRAFMGGYRKVVRCEVGSWDEAFGAPYPGKKIALLKRRRLNRIRVVAAVRTAVVDDPDTAIDDGFWERIGVAIGEGKSQAQTLHAEAIALGLETLSASELKRTGRRSPTKTSRTVGRHRKG